MVTLFANEVFDKITKVKKEEMDNKRKCKKVMAIAICAVFLAAISAVSLASTGTNTEDRPSGILEKKELNHAPSAIEYAPDEILVKFKSGVREDAINTMISEFGFSVKSTLLSGTKLVAIPSGKTVDEMVRIYECLPEVEYAEPNYIAHAFMVPNDTYYSYQWHLDNDEYGGINMESAWDISTGSGVVVAVIDTGVAYEYYNIYCQAPDLAGTTFVQGYDFVNNDTHPNDDEGHGTHVAGTIAQTTNNNYGVAGVAFDCSIMPVKVLNETGFGYYSWIADGIYYAANNSADIISMSLGGPTPSQTLESAVTYAYNEGVTIVAAAGNEYQEGNPPQYPAAYDEYVIAVGATRYNETRSYYSNTGNYLDLTAPGGDVAMDQNGDGYGDGVLQQTFFGEPCVFAYWFFQGTSMATPHVSGVAALLIANGVTGPDNVRDILESTAEDKGAPGWDEEYGWGVVDAYAALLSDEECEGTDTSCGIYPNCENCNDDDGCYAYGNGCEERNYYCYSNEVGCEYTYSNRHTDYHDGWDYYCKGDEVWKRRLFHDFYCDGGSCTDHTSWADDQLVENCNDHDGWYDTGDKRWIEDPGNECKEKEQKKQEYHDYTCSDGSCDYSITNTQWIDTGNTRNKPDGTICGCTANNTLKRCYDGSCSDTGICNSTICGADIACDGKKPGESCGTDRKCNSICNCVKIIIFDTDTPANPYPSIMGTHNGTITPNQTINVSKFYTYPCTGTGGHTEYVCIYGNGMDKSASWTDYSGDWHNITFVEPFTLDPGKTYNYTIRTGSYPQIHHTSALLTANGWINCTKFTDANGKGYNNWIPAIRLWAE